MVSYTVAAKSGKIVIKIAMDGGVPFQFHKTLFQIID